MNLKQKISSPNKLSQRWIASGIVILVLFIFFRHQFFNHFAYLSSERNDGGIQVALLEHWFNVFRGLAHWSSPNYFFPYPKTLSYNEGLFLNGIIYSFFRALSIDAFLSNELVNIVIKGIGFFGFLIASQKMLRLPFFWALLGSAIFTLSDNSFVQVGHAQLLSVSLAPLEGWLIYETVQALMAGQTKPLVKFGSLSILLFSAWMLTCLYIAWFFTMFVSITILVLLCIIGKPGREMLGRAIAANKVSVLAMIALAAASLAPFFSVYFSGQNLDRHRPWSQIRDYVPTLFDSINVGAGNFLFGDMIVALKAGCAMCALGGGEREAGIAPILFILAGICIVDLIFKKISPPAAARLLIRASAIASIIMWFLAMRFGDRTAWHLVYDYWPGGGGLRVVARILLFLAMPATALAVWYLSQSRWPRAVVLILGGLLILEEINTSSVTALDRHRAIELTSNIPKPPSGCRSFFTTESLDTIPDNQFFPIDALYPHNVDAMLIAEFVNLPTINGYASFNPPDWNFGAPTSPDYLLRVQAYARTHNLRGLCKLDLIAKKWDAQPVFAEIKSRSLAYWDFASDTVPQDSIKGFGSAESLGRWSTGNEASFKYTLQQRPDRKTLTVHITVVAALVSDKHSQRVRLVVNDKYQKEFSFQTDVHTNLEVTFPTPIDNQIEIKMEFPDAISPKKMGINEDNRLLAIVVKSIELR